MTIIQPEEPTGTIDGVNQVFFVSRPYAAGSLAVWVQGLIRVRDDDDGFDETNPATGEFTLRIAPLPGHRILASYFDADADPAAGEQVSELSGTLITETTVNGSLEGEGVIDAGLSPDQTVEGGLESESELCATLTVEALLVGAFCRCDDMAKQSYAEVYRGETRTFRLQVNDRYKQPQNLTDHDLFMSVRDGSDESADLLFEKSTVSAGITLEAQSGDTLGQALIRIQDPDTDNANVPVAGKTYTFDVWVRTPSPDFEKIPVIKPSSFVVLPRMTDVPDGTP